MDTRVVIEIFSSIILIIISTLIAYYLTTRDQRLNMDKVAKENIDIHERVKHQDSMYPYVESEINKHEDRCGDIIKLDMKDMKEKVEVIGTTLAQHNLKFEMIQQQLESLDKKMNRLLDHDRTGHL